MEEWAVASEQIIPVDVYEAHEVGRQLDVAIRGSDTALSIGAFLTAHGYISDDGAVTAACACRTLATTFDAQFIRAQMRRAEEEGITLSVAHWVQLARVSVKRERVRLLNKVIRKRLSARTLRHVIAANPPGARNLRFGGRKPVVPHDPAVALARAAALAKQFTRFTAAFRESATQGLPEGTMPAVPAAVCERLKSALAQTRKQTRWLLSLCGPAPARTAPRR
jgi:hypothetical protein